MFQLGSALGFAGPGGIVLTLQHHDDRYDVMKFDCGAFSTFKGEKEILFFGGDTVMKIVGLRQKVGGKWTRYNEWLGRIESLFESTDGLMTANVSNATNCMQIIEAAMERRNINSASMPDYIRKLIVFQYGQVRMKMSNVIQRLLVSRFLPFVQSFVTCHSSNI